MRFDSRIFSGVGEIRHENGDVFSGSYTNNMPHGLGTMTYSDGRVSTGLWENGMQTYKGDLNDKGEPHGRGKKKYLNRNGETYEGDWRDGHPEGDGRYECSDGCVYEGQFKGGAKEGTGTWKDIDGSKYIGDWKGDAMNGFGKKFLPDESLYYQGNYKNGEMHGVGKMHIDGRVSVGIWNYGDMVYEGELNDVGKPNGRGKWMFANGDVYEGQWKDGNKHGKGVMTYANKDVYDGEWSNDLMHGKGVFEYAAGDLWKNVGEWKGGKECGWFKSFPRPKDRYYDQGEVQTMDTEDFE